MNYYMYCLKNYFQFSGRARREEYWMFVLFNIIFIIFTAIMDNMLGTTFKVGGMSLPYGFVYTAYALAVFIPGLAVNVRRLHDVGKSGWMMLIVLIPLIGGIWLIVLNATPGQAGDNKYGPDPKLIADEDE